MGCELPEELNWYEHETDTAVYLLWRRADNTWGGIEFIGADRSKVRNDTFLARKTADAQWESLTLDGAYTLMERVIAARARLQRALQVGVMGAPQQAGQPNDDWLKQMRQFAADQYAASQKQAQAQAPSRPIRP